MVYQNKLTAFLIMIASGIVYNLAAHLNIAGKHVLMQPIPAQATVLYIFPPSRIMRNPSSFSPDIAQESHHTPT